ncbi:MAG: phospholipase D family protein [Methylobacterium mesophilicum]|nr:phospholipase D family protein [Methylobacterium mesophilicum]
MAVVWMVLSWVVLFAAASFATVYSYGRFARSAKGAPATALPLDEDGTALDRAVRPKLEKNPGKSGLMLVASNTQAFALRALSAREAGRSLDLQYYYWKDDLTGRLLGREVLAAADRGVRVRLLIDDINTRTGDRTYAILDSHPNIEVRLFNPSRSRSSPLKRGIELVLRAFSVNRRMHNKAWIADGRVAVVGGRNIGDAYFDAHQSANFRDMDLCMVGPAVGETETIFDRFWNSDTVLPIGAFHLTRPARRARQLDRLRARLEKVAKGEAAKPYLERLRKETDVAALVDGHAAFHWTAEARVISDPPEKIFDKREGDWISRAILPALETARKSIAIISPYFIPGAQGVAMLDRLVKRGVDCAVLTNSLAATDVVAVHGAYAGYRKPVLRAGVRLFELQPEFRQNRMSLFGSSGASLHTKAFTVDGAGGFVGSFNFDPRSISLNTEMGVLFRHTALAEEIDRIFAEETAPDSSYALRLDGSRLIWQDAGEAGLRARAHEPGARLWRRMMSGFIGLLPVESQL